MHCSNAIIFSLQDQNSYGGTPLAMLAAQCSRISNKSPPPLADAAVGKGFHPWKKPPSLQTSPTNIQTSPRSGGGVSTTSSPSNYSKGTAITSSVASSNAVSNYSADLLTTANTSPVGSVLGSQDNMSKLHQADSEIPSRQSLTCTPESPPSGLTPVTRPLGLTTWPLPVRLSSRRRPSRARRSTTARAPGGISSRRLWDPRRGCRTFLVPHQTLYTTN